MNRLSTILSILAISPAAYALTGLGPPTAHLDVGQWGTSLRGTYSNIDMRINGHLSGKEYESLALLEGVHVGISEDKRLELFALAGGADIDTSSDSTLAMGGGFRATSHPDGELAWGVIAQSVFFQGNSRTIDDEYFDTQVAIGPCWRPRIGYSGNTALLFGGAMLHLINGDRRTTGSTVIQDISEESPWGAYIGGGFSFFGSHLELTAEVQVTPTDAAFSAGVMGRF